MYVRGIVKRAVGEAVGGENPADDDQRGAGNFLAADLLANVLKGAAQDDLVGPACAIDHGDWTIGNWRGEPKTGACKTLAAMALRIGKELRSPTFGGRRG